MVFHRSFSQPGAVRLHSSVLDQSKLRPSIDLPDRLSHFHAIYSALDCAAARYRLIRNAALCTGADVNRRGGIVAAALACWHCPDGWRCAWCIVPH